MNFNSWTLVLRKAFDMFDREKKGYIHTNMVSTILRTLGQTFEEGDLQALIAEIDTDGKISIDLYIQRYTKTIKNI